MKIEPDSSAADLADEIARAQEFGAILGFEPDGEGFRSTWVRVAIEGGLVVLGLADESLVLLPRVDLLRALDIGEGP